MICMKEEVPIPKWLVKGKKIELPDGNFVTFTGENPRDYCIIVKDKNDKIHANFVLKPDEYEFHLKNEKTSDKKSMFETYASVIIDMTNHWSKEKPEFIKIFPAKNWENHDELVVDVNSTQVPLMRWREGIYDVDPETLPGNIVPKNKVIDLKFSAGMLFDKYGNCKGMLMAIRKQKKLLLIKKPLLEKVLNTVIGMECMVTAVKEEYEKMKI